MDIAATGAPDSALPGAIAKLLARARLDIRRRRAWRGAWRGGFWGGVLASVLLAARGAFSDQALLLNCALALALLAIAAGVLAGAARRVPPLLAARLADRAFSLQDRIATALETLAMPATPFLRVLLADTQACIEALPQGRAALAGPAVHPVEMRLAVLALLTASLLAVAPPLPLPGSWQAAPAMAGDDRPQASLMERLKQLANDLLQGRAPTLPELSPQATDPAQAPPSNAQEFKDKEIAKPRSDFASFVSKGDERLKLLERTDSLPDLQSDFASSKYRMLMRQAQELSGPKSGGRMSADKLGQILREMERLGRRGGDWNDDVAEGMQALESGQTEGAMSAVQSALDKMRRAEDQERARRALRGGKDAGQNSPQDDNRGDSGGANGANEGGGRGSSPGGGTSPKGQPTARLRSTPYDTAIDGQRRGRMPTIDTQATTRPGQAGGLSQYANEIGQYRRAMEDAISREQVPRDYQRQIREYFKALQE